ncbi:MAG: dihydrofolate reductase family protein [Flavobacteriaceae bacterium]|nr:dihydrofolate reductase family protein [Flavobacteriaceae bacterium]
MTQASQVTIHMVSSLDGFIARNDNTVSWMRSSDNYEGGIELTEAYVADFLKSIDCYIMGSKTYEHALKLGWVYGDTPVVVLSGRALVSDKDSVRFYSGDLKQLVEELLKPKYNNIWMVGGAELTKAFIQQELADKIVISLLPIILGDGLLFFDFVGKELPLHLDNVTTYKDGMVELTYELKKDS